MDPLGYEKCQNLRHSELQLSCALFQDLNTWIIRQDIFLFFFWNQKAGQITATSHDLGPPKRKLFGRETEPLIWEKSRLVKYENLGR